MEKKTLNDLIREEAKKNAGRYNLVKDKTERELKLLHHKICKRLVEIADNNKFPMGPLVYIAIGTNAHKTNVFLKGYTRINEKKTERVLSLCEIFAKKFGEETRTNDKLVHMLSRYVELDGGVLKFKQMINSLDQSTLNMKKIDTARKLSKLLFGDEAQYSKGGYIIEVNKPTRHNS